MCDNEFLHRHLSLAMISPQASSVYRDCLLYGGHPDPVLVTFAYITNASETISHLRADYIVGQQRCDGKFN